jgi:hypothetical protein
MACSSVVLLCTLVCLSVGQAAAGGSTCEGNEPCDATSLLQMRHSTEPSDLQSQEGGWSSLVLYSTEQPATSTFLLENSTWVFTEQVWYDQWHLIPAGYFHGWCVQTNVEAGLWHCDVTAVLSCGSELGVKGSFIVGRPSITNQVTGATGKYFGWTGEVDVLTTRSSSSSLLSYEYRFRLKKETCSCGSEAELLVFHNNSDSTRIKTFLDGTLLLSDFPVYSSPSKETVVGHQHGVCLLTSATGANGSDPTTLVYFCDYTLVLTDGSELGGKGPWYLPQGYAPAPMSSISPPSSFVNEITGGSGRYSGARGEVEITLGPMLQSRWKFGCGKAEAPVVADAIAEAVPEGVEGQVQPDSSSKEGLYLFDAGKNPGTIFFETLRIFHAQTWYDRAQTSSAGFLHGICQRTLASEMRWHCSYSAVLDRRSQVGAKDSSQGHLKSIGHITGGTGKYQGAYGRVVATRNSTAPPSFSEYRFTFGK